MASVAAYQVYDAVASQEVATEQALRAYARFAGWSFAREAGLELARGIRVALAPIHDAGRVGEAGIPDVALVSRGLERAKACRCAQVPEPRFLFRVDLRDRSLQTEGTLPPGPSAQRWVIDTLVAVTQDSAVALAEPRLVRQSGAGRLAIAFDVMHDAAGRIVAAYGFVFDVGSAADAVFPHVHARQALLPPAPPADMELDSALVLRVVDSGDREIFRTAGRTQVGPEVRVPMTGAFSGLSVVSAMRPAFRTRVASGGWGWSRSHLVLGLITVSAGLVIVSLLQLRRERQMARLRADFVSSVSHELRTPLAQIRMFAEMLRLGWVRTEDERRRSVQIIDQEARRLSHLVENVLHFSRTERSAARISLEPLALAPFVDEVVDGFRPLAGTRDATVRAVHAGAGEVLADRNALRQVLLNLLDNAAKYGPAGQVITVGTDRDPVRGVGRLRVDDQGPGIPPRERSRVWEPFRRLDGAVSSGVTGNGIGLAVVRELVRAQGGDVAVEDAPGGGARFVIVLPSAPEPAAESSLPSHEPSARYTPA